MRVARLRHSEPTLADRGCHPPPGARAVAPPPAARTPLPPAAARFVCTAYLYLRASMLFAHRSIYLLFTTDAASLFHSKRQETKLETMGEESLLLFVCQICIKRADVFALKSLDMKIFFLKAKRVARRIEFNYMNNN
jgi:hypothetical protein